MLTLEQRKLRQRGIGSSDVPAILGLSKTPPIEIWRSKLEPIEPDKDTKATRRGNVLEPVVAKLYEEETGFRCAMAGTLSHPAYDWWLATPDRFVYTEDDGWTAGRDPNPSSRILEIKTRWQVQDWTQVAGSPIDPDAMAMRAQILWQLGVVYERFGITKCDLAVLSTLDNLEIITVERNAEEEKVLFEIMGAWWQKHIVERVPPSPDASEEYGKWLASLPNGSKPPLEVKLKNDDPILDELANVWEELLEAKERHAFWKAKEQEFGNIVKHAVREHDLIITPWGRFSNKRVKGHEDTNWEAVARRFMGMIVTHSMHQNVNAAKLQPDPQMIKLCEQIVSEETKMTSGYRALRHIGKIKVTPCKLT